MGSLPHRGKGGTRASPKIQNNNQAGFYRRKISILLTFVWLSKFLNSPPISRRWAAVLWNSFQIKVKSKFLSIWMKERPRGRRIGGPWISYSNEKSQRREKGLKSVFKGSDICKKDKHIWKVFGYLLGHIYWGCQWRQILNEPKQVNCSPAR